MAGRHRPQHDLGLARLKDIELRTIARSTRDRDMMLEHIHDSQRQINEALKELA
jgi:hypothetical protein